MKTTDNNVLRTATLDVLCLMDPCLSPPDSAGYEDKIMHLLSDTGGGCEV